MIPATRPLIVSALAALTPPGTAQPPSSAPLDTICRAAAPADGPGFAALVAVDGVVVHRAAYGLSDLTTKEPLRPEQPFYAASVSKAFTAAAVLHLAAAGRLSLDDPAQRHLPELGDALAGVTLLHLLQHRSGLRDFYELAMLTGSPLHELTTARVLELVKRQHGNNFAPGSDFLYCNTGYLLLAEIVARVSGSSLRDYAAEHVFDPLGMRSTCFRDAAHPDVQGLPTAYERGSAALAPPLLVGPGGLCTTVDDLHRWLAALTDGTWQPALVRQLCTAPAIAPGLLRSPSLEPYAGGILTAPCDGHAALMMLGGFGGWQALALALPEAHVQVALLANGDLDVRRLARELVATATGRPSTPAATTSRRPGFAPFQAADGELAFVATRRDGTTVLTTLGYKVLLAERDGRLVGADCGLPVAVQLDDALAVTIADGPTRRYAPLGMQQVPPEHAASLAGSWRCDELDANVELRAAGGRLTLPGLAPGIVVQPFQALQPDLWISDTGLRLDVTERDADGRPRAARLSTGRARGLALRRD